MPAAELASNDVTHATLASTTDIGCVRITSKFSNVQLACSERAQRHRRRLQATVDGSDWKADANSYTSSSQGA